jgi:DNA-binding IclR family transcriptional regulator
MSQGAQKPTRIQSLARASAILDVIAKYDVATLTTICRETGLNKTTAFHLVESLASLGFAERAAHERGYKLGLRNLELGKAVQRRTSLLEISKPSLVRLCSSTRETVNLAVPYQFGPMIIESLESSYGVRTTSYVGTRAPYHATACGKAILAHLEPEMRKAIYASNEMVAFTPRTITDLAALEKQLAEVQQQGFAFDIEEMEDSAHCVAALIFDGFGAIAGAVSVAGLKTRMTLSVMTEFARLIMAETAVITKVLARGGDAQSQG